MSQNACRKPVDALTTAQAKTAQADNCPGDNCPGKITMLIVNLFKGYVVGDRRGKLR